MALLYLLDLLSTIYKLLILTTIFKAKYFIFSEKFYLGFHFLLIK
jgi:hypothetical protein